MTIVDGKAAVSALNGFSDLPVSRQIALLIGLAISIAIGFYVVLWSREPEFRPIYSNLDASDLTAVVDGLQQTGIKFKINQSNGTVMVPSDKLYEARIELASEGLPKGVGYGFEMLDKTSSFASSQFMESARYQRALAGELARTIGTFRNVKKARVHLAMPKRSPFAGDNHRPSASVMIEPYGGRSMQKEQIAAIVHLVGSSVPNLAYDKITVVDSNGKLLSSDGEDEFSILATRQLDHIRQIENRYAEQIQSILTPLLGQGRVKAQVTAEVDFSTSEQTHESYNPDLPAVRSEQTLNEKNGTATTGGVPGALANQPPSNATLSSTGTQPAAAALSSGGAGNSRVQSTKNYELDKTISYTKRQPWMLKRLSVAVVVDDFVSYGKRGKKETKKPLTKDELKQVSDLVKDAIGFSEARGDSVNVMNKTFASPGPIEDIPSPAFFKQSWFHSLLKQLLGGVFIIFILIGVLKPTLNNLVVRASEREDELKKLREQQAHVETTQSLTTFDSKVNHIRDMTRQDPAKVANVVKNWIDGER